MAWDPRPSGGRARTPSDLRRIVHEVLRRVPRGRVVTYGQLALLAGRPRAAREVGWIAHQGDARLPWHRVVNRVGGLAIGYHKGRAGHRRDLAAEGVRVRRNLTVDLRRYQWWPDGALSRRLGLTLETLAAMSVAQRGSRTRRPPRKIPRRAGPAARRHKHAGPGNRPARHVLDFNA